MPEIAQKNISNSPNTTIQFLSIYFRNILRPEFTRSKGRTSKYRNESGIVLLYPAHTEPRTGEQRNRGVYLQPLDRQLYHAHPFHSVIVARALAGDKPVESRANDSKEGGLASSTSTTAGSPRQSSSSVSMQIRKPRFPFP